MARLVTVQMLLDRSDSASAADDINELLRERQAMFTPGSSLMDYLIGRDEDRPCDTGNYVEGAAFKGVAPPADLSNERAMIRWRAQVARRALELYAGEKGLDLRDELDVALGDLLADLRHLCDVQELCLGDIDRRAQLRYLEELAEANSQQLNAEGAR